MGDLDPDGQDDFLVAGKAAYLARGGSPPIDLQQDIGRGMLINGTGSDLAVAAAGDQDGDSVQDMVVSGSPSGAMLRSAWVVYGIDTPLAFDLSTMGGHLGFQLQGASSLGPAADAGGAAIGDIAADQLIGVPANVAGTGSRVGSVYISPGVKRSNCAESVAYESVDVGAIGVCLDGGEAVALDRDRNGAFESSRQVSGSPPPATASGRRRPPKMNRQERGDTGVRGQMVDDNKWRIRRTGVVLEVTSRGTVTLLGRTKLFHELILRGRRAIHSGSMIPQKGIPTKPRIIAPCRKFVNRDACPIGGGVALPPVEAFADRHYSNGKSGLRFGPQYRKKAQERNHRQFDGNYEWRLGWRASVPYRGKDYDVNWGYDSPQRSYAFVTPNYRCKGGSDGQCRFGTEDD